MVEQQDTEIEITDWPDITQQDEIYVDGVMSLHLRAGVAKIDFYKVTGQNQNNKEIRKISHRIILPTVALSELEKILNNMKQEIKRRKKASV